MDLAEFTATVAIDPGTYRRFLDDPAEVARERDLSDEELGILVAGDRNRIANQINQPMGISRIKIYCLSLVFCCVVIPIPWFLADEENPR